MAASPLMLYPLGTNAGPLRSAVIATGIRPRAASHYPLDRPIPSFQQRRRSQALWSRG